ncbi:unnamed protein product, partial [Phaeothamnion confervicola]
AVAKASCRQLLVPPVLCPAVRRPRLQRQRDRMAVAGGGGHEEVAVRARVDDGRRRHTKVPGLTVAQFAQPALAPGQQLPRGGDGEAVSLAGRQRRDDVVTGNGNSRWERQRGDGGTDAQLAASAAAPSQDRRDAAVGVPHAALDGSQEEQQRVRAAERRAGDGHGTVRFVTSAGCFVVPAVSAAVSAAATVSKNAAAAVVVAASSISGSLPAVSAAAAATTAVTDVDARRPLHQPRRQRSVLQVAAAKAAVGAAAPHPHGRLWPSCDRRQRMRVACRHQRDDVPRQGFHQSGLPPGRKIPEPQSAVAPAA